MPHRLAYNATDVAVATSTGIVAGRDWAAVNESDPLVIQAVSAGRLSWPDPPDADADPRAAAAYQVVRERNGVTGSDGDGAETKIKGRRSGGEG